MKFESSTKLEEYLKKYPRKLYWLLAFMLTAIIYTLMFSVCGLLPNGEYIIARSDMIHQHIPFIEYFCQVLRGEHSYWFSWSNQMGYRTAGMYAYYLMSPFNLLFLLFKHDNIMHAVALVVILKAATSATIMQLFLQNILRKKLYATVLFSILYALNSYQVSFYFALNQTDYLYIFPLVMLGIVKLVDENRVAILMLAHILLMGVSFYMAYSTGIISFIFFVFYFYYKKREGVNLRTERIFSVYFSTVIISFMITAIIWLPAILELIEHRTRDFQPVNSFLNNILAMANNMFIGQLQSLNGNIPEIYCGVVSFILFVCYFSDARIRNREKLYIGVAVVSVCTMMCVEEWNYIMHAFDTPQMFGFRYAFVVSFLLCVIGCKEFCYIRHIKNCILYATIIIFFIIYSGATIYMHKSFVQRANSNSWINMFINLFFIIIWISLIQLCKLKKINVLSFYVVSTVLVAAELIINGSICINRMEHDAYPQKNYYTFQEIDNNTFAQLSNEEIKEYERINLINEKNFNISMQEAIHTIQFFNSFENMNLVQGVSGLGAQYFSHAISGFGIYQVLNTILGVRAYGNMNLEETGGITMPVITEINNLSADILHDNAGVGSSPIGINDRCLSLGYAVNREVVNYKKSDSAFDNQDELLSLMTGTNINCYSLISANCLVDNGILIEYEKGKNESLDEYVANKNITKGFIFSRTENDDMSRPVVYKYSFDKHEQPIYAYLYSKAVSRGDAYIENPNTESFMEETGFEKTINPSSIFEVGKNDLGENEFRIILPADKELDYCEEFYFATYDDDEFQKAYDILSQHQWNINEFDDGYVSGNITADDNELMFTSIPYDSGWKAYVDGKNEEVKPLLDGAFCGVSLEKGNHNIEMVYEEPGKKYGIRMSGLGVIILCIWSIYERRSGKFGGWECKRKIK